jgi:hypothetical protein
MSSRFLVIAVGTALAVGCAWAQPKAEPAAPAKSAYNPPRAADGHPLLEGVWTNGTLTPLERPADLAGKEFFTEKEAAEWAAKRMQQMDQDRPENRRAGDPGSYNQAFWDRGTKGVKTRRTSLVVEPSNGKIPLMTPDAQAKFERTRAEMAKHPSDGPEDRNLSERCLMFSGVGPPMLTEPYNNNYQIIQTPGTVAIQAEMNHDVRVVPIGTASASSPRLPQRVQQWHGDSRGHWEGDTLVVETTNVKLSKQSHFGVVYAGMIDENVRVTERFTRMDADTILYRATVDDPTVYTKPWTVEIPMTARREPLYEYACHEGNYGMFGILGGARRDEEAAKNGKK